MTAPNHAITGALIGLTIAAPEVALPAAFLSHFVCDAIPHYDPPGKTNEEKINSKEFLMVQLVGGAILCFALVICLAAFQPGRWLQAALCAFLAASPDLLSIPRFINVKKRGKDIVERNWFWRFHGRIQWKTGPRFVWVETIWFIVFGGLVAARL